MDGADDMSRCGIRVKAVARRGVARVGERVVLVGAVDGMVHAFPLLHAEGEHAHRGGAA